MKVKIRDEIYNSEDMPIMLILSDEEKRLIGDMIPKNHKFCSFPNKMNIYDVNEFMEGDFKIKEVSSEWIKEYNIKILDPDGWDRRNYNYSFNEEKITRKEFEKRLMFSTIQGFNRDSNGKYNKIWNGKNWE